jgi:NAD(P)-dependent dehydrogenase (short-subunit alcohol dehydrogenase family)
VHSAVVTGAASGIGGAVARRLLAEGIDVLAVDVNAEGLDEIKKAGATPLVADLSTDEGRDAVVSAAIGATRYLVNAAGIIMLKPIFDVELHDIRRIYAVNVEATWDLTSRLGREMPAGGAVVNLSSSSAKLASTTEAAVYASSKTAVLSITRSFAYALAPRDVRVNAVCPGIIDTPMQDRVLAEVSAQRGVSVDELSKARNATVPLGRAASAEECAAVIWFLLSNEASYLTGQAVNVTGGLVTW